MAELEHVNAYHVIGVVTDDPHYSAGQHQARLAFMVRCELRHPTKLNREGTGPLLLSHTTQVRVWGDKATAFGEGDAAVKLGDIVELNGRLSPEPLYAAKEGAPPPPLITAMVIDEVGGEVAYLGQVADDEYERLKAAADQRAQERDARRAQRQQAEGGQAGGARPNGSARGNGGARPNGNGAAGGGGRAQRAPRAGAPAAAAAQGGRPARQSRTR